MIANCIFFNFNLNNFCLYYFGCYDFAFTITFAGADAQSHIVVAIGEAIVPPASLPLVIGSEYVISK
jgi:hypothetical protein